MNRFYVALVLAALGASASLYAEDEVITNPKGDRVVYSRSSVSVMPMGDTPMETEEYGFAGVLVFGENDEVYLRNPFSQFVTGSYLEGLIAHSTDSGLHNMLVFELPQLITIYEEDGESYDLFACMMQFSKDGERVEMADNQMLEFFHTDDNGWEMADYGSSFLGLTFDDSEWTGFAEKNIVYLPISDVPAETPEGVEFEPWMMTYGNEGHYVDVAIDGDKCYVKNFLDTSEKSLAPTVGTVTENGIVFSSPQYLGVNEDNSYLTYFYGGEVKRTYIEDVNTTVTSFIPADEMTFETDGEGKYVSGQSAMFTPYTDIESEYFWSMGFYEKPSLQKSVSQDLVPANPSVVDYCYYPNYMFGYVSFEIPMLNTEGQILDSSHLYYNVYFDGELLELNPDEYPLLRETLIDIPYDFEDRTGGSGDIKIEGSKHTLIIYREGLEEIGIQSFYVDESGERYNSDLITCYTSGIETMEADNIAEETYIDLAGNRVQIPGKGMYIRLVRLTDGTVIARKVVL